MVEKMDSSESKTYARQAYPILFQAVKRNSTHFDEFTAKMEKLVILMTGSDSFFSCTGFS